MLKFVICFNLMVFGVLSVKNSFSIDRVECSSPPNSSCPMRECDLRLLSRDRFYLHIHCHLIRPLKSINLHGVLNYRYNTYQKFLIDRWEDVCGYFADNKSSLLINLFMQIISNYTSFNHTCPFTEDLFVLMTNYSMNEIIVKPLLPAGQFRMDINFTEGERKKSILGLQVYFKVSDYRIWQK